MSSFKDGKVKNLGKVFAGGTPKTENAAYYGKGHYWLPSGRVQNTILTLPKEGEAQITDLGLKESSAKLIKPNSVLVAITGSTCSNVALLKFEATANQSVVAIEPNSNVDSNYLFYGMLNLKDEIIKNKSGGAQGGVNLDIIKNLPIRLPDLATQQRIAVFLDQETSKIDALSEELTKFKSTLLLQKRSLVSECVTKGIPNERERAYKPSGLYWMGDIASNYEIVKLNNITSDKINDGPHTTPEFFDDGMPFLSVNNIQDHKLDFKNLRMVSKEAHEEYIKKAHPKKGDILLGKSASIGKTAIVDVDFEFSIWSPLALIKISPEKAYSKFVYYVFISDEMQEQIDLESSESTQKNIGMGKISALKIQVPPIDEQQRIADYLDTEAAKIDALIGEIDNQVNLLKTYRKSLINEVITGKIEV